MNTDFPCTLMYCILYPKKLDVKASTIMLAQVKGTRHWLAMKQLLKQLNEQHGNKRSAKMTNRWSETSQVRGINCLLLLKVCAVLLASFALYLLSAN